MAGARWIGNVELDVRFQTISLTAAHAAWLGEKLSQED
jgi:hypothetical protein